MNRGRIQAQGGGTEKSNSWSTENEFTKTMGIIESNNLENQLTRPELNLRDRALEQARNRINTAPVYGISAEMKKSYYNDIRNRKIRIDIEINSGIAFVEDNNG